MSKFLPLDVIVDPTEQATVYIREHLVAFVLISAAVVAAIVLLVVMIKISHKKTSK